MSWDPTEEQNTASAVDVMILSQFDEEDAHQFLDKAKRQSNGGGSSREASNQCSNTSNRYRVKAENARQQQFRVSAPPAPTESFNGYELEWEPFLGDVYSKSNNRQDQTFRNDHDDHFPSYPISFKKESAETCSDSSSNSSPNSSRLFDDQPAAPMTVTEHNPTRVEESFEIPGLGSPLPRPPSPGDDEVDMEEEQTHATETRLKTTLEVEPSESSQLTTPYKQRQDIDLDAIRDRQEAENEELEEQIHDQVRNASEQNCCQISSLTPIAETVDLVQSVITTGTTVVNETFSNSAKDTASPVPIVESATNTANSKNDVVEKIQIVREGKLLCCKLCGNLPVVHKDWDREFCSADCAVKYCKNVFSAWVAARKPVDNGVVAQQ